METITYQAGTKEIRDALRVAEIRRARKIIARNLRRETGSPLASDIRASIERGDWS
jgi:hypothetical protein